jgi:hypothetical protein
MEQQLINNWWVSRRRNDQPAFGSTYILAKTENTDAETPVEDNWVGQWNGQ